MATIKKNRNSKHKTTKAQFFKMYRDQMELNVFLAYDWLYQTGQSAAVILIYPNGFVTYQICEGAVANIHSPYCDGLIDAVFIQTDYNDTDAADVAKDILDAVWDKIRLKEETVRYSDQALIYKGIIDIIKKHNSSMELKFQCPFQYNGMWLIYENDTEFEIFIHSNSVEISMSAEGLPFRKTEKFLTELNAFIVSQGKPLIFK